MSLPKFIETNWCSKGKAILSFTSDGKKLVENDTVVYLSTLYIKEFVEKPKQPDENYEINNGNASFNDLLNQEDVRPPGISSELWQDWIVHWEHWKEIYIPLAWVEKYRSVCTPEYISWHDDYLNDFPGVLPCLQEGLDVQDKTQITDSEKLEDGIIDDKEVIAVRDSKEDWEVINSEDTQENCTKTEEIVNSSNKEGKSSEKDDLDLEYEKFSKQRFWVHMWIFLNNAGIESNDELSEYFITKTNYEIRNAVPKCDIYDKDSEEHFPLEESDSLGNIIDQINSCHFENVDKKDVKNEKHDFSKNIENNDENNTVVLVEDITLKDRIDGENKENSSEDLQINLNESTKKLEDVCENAENGNIIPGDNELNLILDNESKNETGDIKELKSGENDQTTESEGKLSPRGQKRHMEENIKEDQEFLSKMTIDMKSASKKCRKNLINQRLSSGVSWAMQYIVKESNESVCPFKLSEISQDIKLESEQTKIFTSSDGLEENENVCSTVPNVDTKPSSPITTYENSQCFDGNDFSENNDLLNSSSIEEINVSTENMSTENISTENMYSDEDYFKNKGKKSKYKSKKINGTVQKVQPWWWFRMGKSVNKFLQWCTSRIFRIMVSSIEGIVSFIFPEWLQRAITFGSAWNAVEKPTSMLNKWLKATTHKPSSANTIRMFPNLYLYYFFNDIDERMPQTVYQSVDTEDDKVYITNLQLDEENEEDEDEESWIRTHVVFDEDGNPQASSTLHSTNNTDGQDTAINKIASDKWKEMLQGYQVMGSSIVKDAPPALPQELHKYWAQRYRLFLKFDQGIQMDQESWYSVTPEMIAAHHAYRCSCDVVVDAFCGSGGNAIQLAYTCNQVIAVDIDPNKIKLARHNAEVYGVADRIQFIVGDFFKLAPRLTANVVYLSPPWGGIEYLSEDIYNVSELGGCMEAKKLMDAAQTITNNIALYLPRTSNLYQVIELAGAGGSVDIEANMMGRKKKAITAYYGDLVNTDHCE